MRLEKKRMQLHSSAAGANRAITGIVSSVLRQNVEVEAESIRNEQIGQKK